VLNLIPQRPLRRLALLGFILSGALFAAEPTPLPAVDSDAVSLETGLLWEIGSGTPIPYRLVPTLLSWRSGEFFGRNLRDGSRIVLRHRLTLIGTWIEHGPESRYIGVAGSPSLEWWNQSGTTSLYTGSGGGAGLIDSQHVKGAQGQDLTFNWFIRGGLEHITLNGLHLTAGIMYQHMSNGGQPVPNPGIDALGFTLGCGRKF
jgi:lipid A 3-O-deacylase